MKEYDEEDWLVPWHEAAHKFVGENIFHKRKFLYCYINDRTPACKMKNAPKEMNLADREEVSKWVSYTLAGYAAEIIKLDADVENFVVDLVNRCRIVDELGVEELKMTDDMIVYQIFKRYRLGYDVIISEMIETLKVNINNLKTYWKEYLQEVKQASKFFKIPMKVI